MQPTAPRTFMRNWPVKYRILQKFGDATPRSPRSESESSPSGVGGQSLALVKASPNQSQATALIHFLTSLESQKILGLVRPRPATRTLPYTDQNLKAFIPHLGDGPRRDRGRPAPADPSDYCGVLGRASSGR